MTSPQRPAWLEQYPSPEVRDLDPAHHALIEASAGTGKTFAVEHLVLRLLMEHPDWMPEDILLLSFTEKTAADLRDRIRALLHRQVRPEAGGKPPVPGWSEADLHRLRALWMHADDLAVHTLHAFCQSALRRDPLASGALIRDEVVQDQELADEALENLLRGPWAEDPEQLARRREALGLNAGDTWREKLIRPALDWQPWRGDRLVPEGDPGMADKLEAQIPGALREWLEALEALEGSAFTRDAFRRSFAFTATGKAKKNWEEGLRKNALEKVFRYESECRALPGNARAEGALHFFLKNYTKASTVVKNGWETALPAEALGLDEWKRLCVACAAMRTLATDLVEARRLRDLGMRAEAVRQLREELAREKKRRGVISYDDMLANLALALRADAGLAMRLRRRYKACIVDEFQDTDPVQWEILRTLCLSDADAEDIPSLPLFLVGDPKQAIYGFRGGDLRTYLAARGTFRDLAANGRAQGFGLDANFRSRPVLIDALNAVFAHPDWFGQPRESAADPAWHLPAESEDVSFTPVRAGLEDAWSDPCVILREFAPEDPEEAPKKSAVDHEVRRWVVARIVAMLDSKKYTAEKIAVLVRKNSEGEAIERLLRRRGVKCNVRRRGGLFHGAAADALRLLLEWIDDAAAPDVQARLQLRPVARESAADRPRGPPLRCPPLVAGWAALARAGRWPEFFDAVRRQGGYRARLAAESLSEAERFDRLTRLLAEAGSAPGTTARALGARFDAWRRGEDDEETGTAAEPQDADGVTVMTLHLSKGLEFPVVFLAASGEGKGSDHFVLRPRHEKGFRIVLDKKDPDARAAHDAQERDEEKRLFYVGFTRAKEELYIPLLPAQYQKGKSGPLGGFAAQALRDAAGAEATRALFRRDDAPVHDLVLETASQNGTSASKDNGEERERLLAETREAFSRRRRLESYSALSRRAGTPEATMPESVETEELVEETGARLRREEPPVASASEMPETVAFAGITAEELPPGAASGTALHAILERTPFASAAEAADPSAWLGAPGRKDLVEDALRRESVDPAHAPAAARAVWNALRMPLPDLAGGTLRLAELSDPSDYRHEVEFLFPFSAEGEPPVGVKRRGSFLWGFIDLVFRKDGRYHLLDWKSNLLPSYDEESVRRSMDAHRYDLQWKLYAIVLDRWLQANLPGYVPELHFGGVHYLYLRGASPERFSGFQTRPTPQQLRVEFPEEIRRLMRNGGREVA